MKGTLKNKIDKVGSIIIEAFHVVGIFVIGFTIIWAAAGEYYSIMQNSTGHASLKDILLMFIYLELGAMTGIYFKTHKMPVVFLIFIAITAITRFLVIDMKELTSSGTEILIGLVVSILILSITALVLRYSDNKYDEEEY